ncbi:hypothetical protein [Pseudonocardia spinosispora]|uniref:hypothetical protein n=1 Tax=Pseudonocardia spinosispora TaxID=103441 RepID=UPI000490C7E3|nr:hypothetical protein [Pseudonocardia spinosispora]
MRNIQKLGVAAVLSAAFAASMVATAPMALAATPAQIVPAPAAPEGIALGELRPSSPDGVALGSLRPAGKDYRKGYREGYRHGFADGKKSCRGDRGLQSESARDDGYRDGYREGFAAGEKKCHR